MNKLTAILLIITNVSIANQCIFDEEYTKQLIIKHEGIRYKIYTDATGHKTIGIGHNLDTKYSDKLLYPYAWFLKIGFRINKEQAYRMFDCDFREAVSTAIEYIGVRNFFYLHPKAQSVLIDMSFNLGNNIRKFKKLKERLLKEDYKGAAREMKHSKWYKQTKARAKELVGIMVKCTPIKKGK